MAAPLLLPMVDQGRRHVPGTFDQTRAFEKCFTPPQYLSASDQQWPLAPVISKQEAIALAGMFKVILMFALVAIGGDVSAMGRDHSPRGDQGVIFGRFDVTESEIGVTHVVLVRLKPTKLYMGGGGERRTQTYTNGDFYSVLSPGLYVLTGFYSGNKFFALDGSYRNFTFRLEPGTSVYAGTYKLWATKGGFLRKDKGSFERIDNPADEIALRDWAAKEMAR